MSDDPSVRTPLGRCTSIDADPVDQKLLPCARKLQPNAGGHRSVEEAVTALLECSDEDTRHANIIGHGHSGVLITGTGYVLRSSEPSTFVGTSNRGTWEPQFKRLRGRILSLTLWGCDVGGGPDGAALLAQLFEIVQVPVEAPTGTMFCEGAVGYSLERGARWQVASAEHAPAVIDLPEPLFRQRRTSIERAPLDTVDDVATIKLIDSDRTVWVTDVVSLALYRGDRCLGTPYITRYRPSVAELLTFVEFDDPFSQSGHAAGVITGALKLTFERFGDEQHREFTIYNNRLLRDLASPSTYYRAADFSAALRTLP